MKKRVLLIDESLTVQKVVALTLDKSRYVVSYAKTRGEAMAFIMENSPHIILVSDQVPDFSIASFPKEVESWVGGNRSSPPIILITSQDVSESRNFTAVLRKPFSPQVLQGIVAEHCESVGESENPAINSFGTPRSTPSGQESDEQNLQNKFNQVFNDEAKLVKETFKGDLEQEQRATFTIPAPEDPVEDYSEMTDSYSGIDGADFERSGALAYGAPLKGSRNENQVSEDSFRSTESVKGDDLWKPASKKEGLRDSFSSAGSGTANPKSQGLETGYPNSSPTHTALGNEPPLVMGADDSMAYKALLENKVEDKLRGDELYKAVNKALERLIPPIVERLVQERLDKLLKEEEEFLEMK